MKKEHKIIDGIEYKECSCCKQWLPVSSYHKDSSKWDGLHGFCVTCKKIKDHNTYCKNPGEKYKKVLEYQRRTGLISKYKPYNPKYYSSEKSKRKKRARDLNRRTLLINVNAKNKITAEIISLVKDKYNNKCIYCGADCSEKYTIDHKVPLIRGGDNDIENLALCCKKCNSSKHDKTDIEYFGKHI